MNESIIPRFETPAEAISFLKISKPRKCKRCKGSLKGSPNVYFCINCQESKKKEVASLKKSQAFYAKNPHLIPAEIRAQMGFY
jgi:hypothetical protein